MVWQVWEANRQRREGDEVIDWLVMHPESFIGMWIVLALFVAVVILKE